MYLHATSHWKSIQKRCIEQAEIFLHLLIIRVLNLIYLFIYSFVVKDLSNWRECSFHTGHKWLEVSLEIHLVIIFELVYVYAAEWYSSFSSVSLCVPCLLTTICYNIWDVWLILSWTMTRKGEAAIQCCKKILVNICSVFCRNLICLLLNGLIFFQDSDFLGCGEKEETKEERSRALVSTSSPRGITRFVLSYLMFFWTLQCDSSPHWPDTWLATLQPHLYGCLYETDPYVKAEYRMCLWLFSCVQFLLRGKSPCYSLCNLSDE